jgi:hypothetical protein
MKSFVIALVLVVAPLLAHAQTGVLELFGDRAGSSCVLADTPNFQSVFVFLTGGGPATGVFSFSAPRPACWNTVWLSDNWAPNAGKLGGSQTSISIFFGECRSAPWPVVEILYLAGGTATPCCQYEVVVSAATAYAACDFSEPPVVVGPRSVTIKSDQTCPCDLPLETESMTWGHVKALYQ